MEKKTIRSIFKSQLTNIIDHTEIIREINVTYNDNHELKFRAGQFVMLHVPQESGKPALRAYSIASPESETKTLRLIFKKVPNGVASTYVWNLNKGAELSFTGPFGRLFFPENLNEQIVFLNTGSGVSQHLSYINSNLEVLKNKKIKMFFGLRYEHDIYLKEELNNLKQNLKDFHIEFVLSRPSEFWTGCKGYVQDHLKRMDLTSTPTTFFLCGNGGMIDDTKKYLTEELKLDKACIFAEAFD